MVLDLKLYNFVVSDNSFWNVFAVVLWLMELVCFILTRSVLSQERFNAGIHKVKYVMKELS
jgi:hypothetical protein